MTRSFFGPTNSPKNMRYHSIDMQNFFPAVAPQKCPGDNSDPKCEGCKGGACCIDGVCYADYTSSASCAAAKGTWIAGASCDDSPCQGPCCCGGLAEASTKAYCEGCGLDYGCINYENNSYRSVSSCKECNNETEYCDTIDRGVCGTWYEECALSGPAYNIEIIYGSYPYVDRIGPKGKCVCNQIPIVNDCCNKKFQDVTGHYTSLEACEAAYASVLADYPDIREELSPGCKSGCINEYNPLP